MENPPETNPASSLRCQGDSIKFFSLPLKGEVKNVFPYGEKSDSSPSKFLRLPKAGSSAVLCREQPAAQAHCVGRAAEKLLRRMSKILYCVGKLRVLP